MTHRSVYLQTVCRCNVTGEKSGCETTTVLETDGRLLCEEVLCVRDEVMCP